MKRCDKRPRHPFVRISEVYITHSKLSVLSKSRVSFSSTPLEPIAALCSTTRTRAYTFVQPVSVGNAHPYSVHVL